MIERINSVGQINIQADEMEISATRANQQLDECTRWTQTDLSLPPTLPTEVESMWQNFLKYLQRKVPTVQCTSSPLTQKQPITRSYSRIASIVSNTSGK